MNSDEVRRTAWAMPPTFHSDSRGVCRLSTASSTFGSGYSRG